MTLENEIKQDKLQAMKNKDTLKKNVLALIASRIQNKKIEKKVDALSHEEEVQEVSSELKQARDALEGAEKSGRQDLIDKEKAKIAIIEAYLPKQLTEEEITAEVQDLVTEGMTVKQAMGVVMPKMRGRADMKVVSEIVRAVAQGGK